VIIRSREQMQPFTARPTWKPLDAHDHTMHHQHLRLLFADHPGRCGRVAGEAAGIYLDDSKNRVTDEAHRLLAQFAASSGRRGRMDVTFSREKVVVTEERAVLHAALRAAAGERCVVDGGNVVPGVEGGVKP